MRENPQQPRCLPRAGSWSISHSIRATTWFSFNNNFRLSQARHFDFSFSTTNERVTCYIAATESLLKNWEQWRYKSSASAFLSSWPPKSLELLSWLKNSCVYFPLRGPEWKEEQRHRRGQPFSVLQDKQDWLCANGETKGFWFLIYINKNVREVYVAMHVYKVLHLWFVYISNSSPVPSPLKPEWDTWKSCVSFKGVNQVKDWKFKKKKKDTETG